VVTLLRGAPWASSRGAPVSSPHGSPFVAYNFSMPAPNDAVIQKKLDETIARLGLSAHPEPELVRRLRSLGFTTRQISEIREAIADTSPALSMRLH